MPTPTKQHQTASLPTEMRRGGRSALAAVRAIVVAAVLLAVAAGLALSVVHALRAGTDTDPSAVVRAAVGALGALVAVRSAFWSFVAAFVCLAEGPGRTARLAERALRSRAPFLARKLLVGTVGATLVLAPLPASAVVTAPDVAAPAHVAADARILPGQVLAWPVTTEPPASRTTTRGTPDEAARTVVVRPGDTLWGLTAAALPDASPADLVAAWPVLHRLNHDAVGDDPRQLQPGTRLHLPAVDDDARAFLTTDLDRPETR
ncbi:LysM peptidoglycan-binding domain-containing protein [Flavimobilis sp. GY10621]|uniref:LysM peptidoglycan-binding domain-containing protein n=1 Tax=Flavimobilis rhizosphaerae TaxID=2775421 RepID=A0ABR9DPC8_9MICO|nr:LysM peptidoglycan-binding domain-containing protein [Flavimobilis rhizosphaerae]MBD9698975.1 LysM peptidoglycan-binding domain-containing protein [Flavimobilis rhizosphaerae]